jgi:alpha-glucosidase
MKASRPFPAVLTGLRHQDRDVGLDTGGATTGGTSPVSGGAFAGGALTGGAGRRDLGTNLRTVLLALLAVLSSACGTDSGDDVGGSGATGGAATGGAPTAATGGAWMGTGGVGANVTTGGSTTGGTTTGGATTGGATTGGMPTGGGGAASGGVPASGGAPTGGVAAGGTATGGGGNGGVQTGGAASGGVSTGGEAAGGGTGGVVDGPYTVSSPDGRIQTELTTTDSVLRYRITVDGVEVLAPSEVGIRTDGVDVGNDVSLGTIERGFVDEQYDFFGGHSTAVNQANEGSVPATSGSESFTVDLHVANDGVGIRLRLPAKAGRRIEGERSVWRLDGNPTVWATELDAAYEEHYRTTTLNSLAASAYGMPLTAKMNDLYVSITEAALRDYGDMALRPGGSGALEGTLYADPSGWTTDGEVVQPWRVTIIADDLTALVNSTLVQNLNPPRDASLDGADWIRPGRSTWQWMAIGAPQFADQHQWVDWTEELGFEFYLVDDGWKDWPDAWNSLRSVCEYAASKGVAVWLWVHSNEVENPSSRQAYFSQAANAGIVGVKVDFPPACNRQWSTWYWDVARDAADQQLLVDVHGANKPTGIERTWPNMLTREGIRGHEWQMTRYSRVLEPEHDTILPFTRLVAGAGDYTPTVFAAQELQGNTWAHELAQGVVFTSPFQCFSGHPQDYVTNPAVDVLRAIPAVWDETIVLPGSEPGTLAAFARRSGTEWFVGILNGPTATSLQVSLDFLGAGDWASIRLGDVSGSADAWDRQEGTVSASDSLQVDLASRGGFVGWFRQ